jgi:hypothetical protein
VKVLTSYTFTAGKQPVVQIVVYNDGPSDAYAVLAAVKLPPGLTVVSAPGGYRDRTLISTAA